MDQNSFIKDISGIGPIFFQSWLPADKPSAIMILIHGFGEHSSRYGTHFAEFYTNSNIGIFTFDLPGHGNTPGKRGHITNPDKLLETLDLLIKQIKADYPQ